MNIGIIFGGAVVGFLLYAALSYADVRLRRIKKFSLKLEALAAAIAIFRPLAALPLLMLLLSWSSFDKDSPWWWAACVPPLAWFAGALLGDSLAGGRLWRAWR